MKRRIALILIVIALVVLAVLIFGTDRIGVSIRHGFLPATSAAPRVWR